MKKLRCASLRSTLQRCGALRSRDLGRDAPDLEKLFVTGRLKGRFRNLGWFWRTYPRYGFCSGGTCERTLVGFRSGATSERTLVPVFVPGEHPPKPPFWKPPFCHPQILQEKFGLIFRSLYNLRNPRDTGLVSWTRWDKVSRLGPRRVSTNGVSMNRPILPIFLRDSVFLTANFRRVSQKQVTLIMDTLLVETLLLPANKHGSLVTCSSVILLFPTEKLDIQGPFLVLLGHMARVSQFGVSQFGTPCSAGAFQELRWAKSRDSYRKSASESYSLQFESLAFELQRSYLPPIKLRNSSSQTLRSLCRDSNCAIGVHSFNVRSTWN